MIQGIATSLLSGAERDYISLAGFEKWTIGRYAEYLKDLPFELRQAVSLDKVASSPDKYNLIMEKFVQYLLVSSKGHPAPIASLVETRIQHLRSQEQEMSRLRQ